MITIEVARALAPSLPETSEGERHGHRTWDVGVFTIEHFANYPAVLVHLRSATRATLRDLLVDAWFATAPAHLSAQYSVAALRRPGVRSR